MKIFQNRITALVIAAVVVIGSTLLNAKAGLAKETAKQEAAFYTVSTGEAPDHYIDERLSSAYGMIQTVSAYDSLAAQAQAVRQARNDLADAQDGRNIHGMYAANVQLEMAGNALAASAEALLTGTDASVFQDYATRFSGSQRMLSSSSYNETVQKYIATVYDRFPGNLLSEVVGVDAPALFE